MKKVLSLLIVLALMCSLLCGCMLNSANIKINADGSGVFKSFTGYTKEALVEYISAMGESEEAINEIINDAERYTYNGITYYGETEITEFNNVDESYEFLGEGFKLEKNGDGSFKFVVKVEEIKEQDIQQTEELYGMSEEDLLENMVVFYDIEFPDNVSKIYGDDIEGIEIDRNKLHIDMVKASMSVENTQVLVFETLKDGEKAEDKALKFSDVVENQWFYHPVMTLANGGLVQGKGNGVFDPDGTLTYAEFCQILARAQGLEYGEENEYWAAKAVKSCVDMGYISDLGEVIAENYDVKISREASIAAMFRAFGYYTDENEFTEEDIPDFKLVSEEFREDIMGAYNFGITQGKDANMTFDPKGTLTRAEVCQLFYNIGHVIGY